MNDKRFLLVSGVARSGTTVLGAMLDLHPDICILVERFESNNRKGSLSSELFTSENITNKEDWEKFQKSTVVGDKIPGIYDIEKVDEGFDNPLYIYIFRDPLAVALSWQDRADDPKDPWSPMRNRLESLIHQRSTYRAIERAPFKDRIILVSYNAIFSHPEKMPEKLNRLASMLGVRPVYTEELLHKFISGNEKRRTNQRGRGRKTQEERLIKAVEKYYPSEALKAIDEAEMGFADQFSPGFYEHIANFYAQHASMEVQVRNISEHWGLPTLKPRKRHIEILLAEGLTTLAIVQAVRWLEEVPQEKRKLIRKLIIKTLRKEKIGGTDNSSALYKLLKTSGYDREAELIKLVFDEDKSK